MADLEYLPSTDFDLKHLARHLPRPLHADGQEAQRGTRSFYDTFDARLRAKDLHLVHEDGFLKLFGMGGRELAALRADSAPEKLDPAELPLGPLHDRVAPVCGLRVLLRSAEIQSNRRVLAVLDQEEKTVVRVVAEQAALSDGARTGDRLRPRLRILPVRGYDKVLDDVRRVLEDELGLTRAPETLEEELHARLGSSPAGLSSDGNVGLTADLPADRAAVALCMRLLHVIESNIPGTLGDLDTEFLHDLRVAVRRTRSLLRELKTVFPPGRLEHFRGEFKWLQQVTGPSRDLDVYLLEFGDFVNAVPEALRADVELLRELLEEHRADEREQMESALRSARTSRLLSDWAAFLEQLPSEPVDDRPNAVMPIGDLAAQRIDKVYRQMVKMGRAVDDNSPHSALHDLRKKGKELRYLLEFFAPLFPGKVTKPMVKTLKALQDTLGRFQDREVQVEMIRGLGPELGERPGGAQALMTMGVLIERLDEQQHEARGEFHERFEAFSAPEQRRLVKKTFG